MDKLSPTDVSMRFHVEEAEKWRKLCRRIPSLQFPSHWHVQIIPPFSGAICRFQVASERFNEVNECAPDDKISIYLDIYERLGYGGGPYWEVYPYPYDNGDGTVSYDTFRCGMEETDKLLKAISIALGEEQESDNLPDDDYEF